MYVITIKQLNKEYEGKKVLDNFELKIDKGQKVLIKGNSGLGKTTLLRCLAGLEDYDGNIEVDGSLSYVFQENRFMPWLSIYENLLLPAKLNGNVDDEYKDKLYNIAKDLEVEEHLNKFPEEVSGGQLQRLSIIQGMLIEPDCLMLDEPLKSVEGQLYIKLYQYILNWSKQNNTTLIYVTHEKVDENDFDNIINMI